jgi:hypothetical protein
MLKARPNRPPKAAFTKAIGDPAEEYLKKTLLFRQEHVFLALC